MKRINIAHITAALLFTFFFTACKKERAPRLIVHVQTETGIGVPGATVRAWHGDNPPSENGSNIYNSVDFDQTGITDGVGDVVFDFPNSAVLDVDVILTEQRDSIDTSGTQVFYLDTLLEGHKVVKIESIRQRDEVNEFNETIEVN